jgi:DNA replication protein DnaC
MSQTTHDHLLDKIRGALKDLRLPEMLAQLDKELAAGPSDDDTRLHFLWRLLDVQVRVRRERAVDRRIRDARFPAHKTLDGFHFSFQPDLNRDRVLELATLDFVRQGQNVLFGGMSGTGKSHLCIALGHLACLAGLRTLYTTSADLLATLHASLATGHLGEGLKPYLAAELLIIDEVGLDRPERDTSRDAHLFYKVIAPRYDKQRSTIITSNIDWDNWGHYLGDDVATVAILDRLVHHGHLVTINGPSWRAHEHQKLNAVAADATTTPTE